MRRVHWIAEFELSDGTVRWWSGEGDVTINSVVYSGVGGPNGSFVQLSPITTSVTTPTRRATVILSLSSAGIRMMLQADVGAIEVKIGYITSLDGGAWTKLPLSFVGRLSRPVIKNGLYTAELETYGGDIDRGKPLYWSKSAQAIRDPTDKGFDQAAEIADGKEIDWPR